MRSVSAPTDRERSNGRFHGGKSRGCHEKRLRVQWSIVHSPVGKVVGVAAHK
jgi:hypothetical protein